MFKNYCVVIIGETDDAEKDVLGVVDSNLSLFQGGGLHIYTFTSAVSIAELTDWFKSHNRNFLVFDLSEKSSGFNITIPDIHEKLFGFLSDQKLNEINENFEKSVADEEIEFIELPQSTVEESNKSIEKLVDSMTENDKKEMVNELLEKTELTEKDKIILQFLVK